MSQRITLGYPVLPMHVLCDIELVKAWEDIFLVSVSMQIELIKQGVDDLYKPICN